MIWNALSEAPGKRLGHMAGRNDLLTTICRAQLIHLNRSRRARARARSLRSDLDLLAYLSAIAIILEIRYHSTAVLAIHNLIFVVRMKFPPRFSFNEVPI